MDEIGKLGFGFMRLPVVEGDGGKEIDIEQVKHMVDLFMDAGFTYFDTARGYHNGRSEAALRRAGMTKDDVRAASRELGLFTADKPSFSCIAVHVGAGRPVTAQALAETAEPLGVTGGKRP